MNPFQSLISPLVPAFSGNSKVFTNADAPDARVMIETKPDKRQPLRTRKNAPRTCRNSNYGTGKNVIAVMTLISQSADPLTNSMLSNSTRIDCAGIRAITRRLLADGLISRAKVGREYFFAEVRK